MSKYVQIRLKWVVLVAALLTLLSVAAAQQGRGGGQPLPAPQPSLMEEARANGSVAVIIAVDAPYAVESSLSVEGVKQQRAAIAAARGSVLAEIAAYRPEVKPASNEWTIPFMALRVSAEGLAALQRSRSVTGIYPDTINRLFLNSALPVEDVPEAHLDGHTGVGAVVAVLDTGVQKNHVFLAGQVVAEACYSTNFAPQSSTSLCPSGAEAQTGSGAANPNKCSEVDGCYHGTHVAGIVAGKPMDPASVPGGTISGVAPGAKIYAVQVFSKISSASLCGGPSKCIVSFTSDMISALQRINSERALYNIAAVNLSLGGGRFFGYCDTAEAPSKAAIDALVAGGVATIIASGNNGFVDSVSSPACISTAVSVGSVTDALSVSSFSNANFTLDLWGVGSDVYSSVFNDQFESLDGTSMATPMVAGAWAVIKGIRPDASVAEVLNTFLSTGISIADINVTTDLIQVGNAADMAAGVPPASNVLTDPGFEGALTPRVSAWTKSGSGIKLLCDGLNAHAGLCYVRAASGDGKLSQTITPVGFSQGDLMMLTAYLSGNKAKSGSVLAKITLSNGKTQKIKLKADGTFAYTYRSASAILKQDATKVKVWVQATSGGKMYADDISLSLNVE